jgi:DNA-binding protein HU-beta
MKKDQLIVKIAKEAKISRAQAAIALDAAMDSVVSSLKKGGGPVKVGGFGAFSVQPRKKRVGRNPQTGTPVKVMARRKLKFKASPEFKKMVSGG